MIDQNTSAYWRRHLGLDPAAQAESLGRYRSWHRLLRPVFYCLIGLFLRFYCRITVVGLENLPAGAPYIIAANHASSLDYACLAWALGRRREELYPLATKLFYDIFLTRFWIKVAANAVRIDAAEDFFPALRAAAGVLRAGGAVYINPEGRRSTGGQILPFRPGVGVLAVETGAPLVPVHLGGTWRALPAGRILPRPYPVRVSIGRPILMDEYVKKEKSEQAYDVYKAVTEELRKRILELSGT